jgi:phosphosulfolactate synthase
MPGSDVNGFLNVPARSPKPRERGITHVMDKGLTIHDVAGLFETAGDYVDIVKLGWGTAYVTINLREKVELCRSHGTPVVCGGTFFEAVVGLGKLDEYRRWLAEHGITHVEVSDGTLGLEREEKLEFIADLARDFVVLSEVGSKDEATVFAPYQWVEWITEELEAGAWKVIAEGREGGTAGIFRPNGEMRTGLIDEIAHKVDVADIVFEAPTKASQGYFVKHFGPDVNLGNIPPDEVIPLETLRLGLRSDTLKEILLREQPATAD